MKKSVFAFVLALLTVFSAVAMTSCGSAYVVDLPIGDGGRENDNVTCHYEIAEKLKDGYELKGYFTAEAEADLADEFVFSVSFDGQYSDTFRETVLYSFKGEDLKNANGGKLSFVVKFDKLSDVFPETADAAKFSFYFHRASAERTDIIGWNNSEYSYTFDGSKLSLEK